ncbi:hypothetical protein GGR51DRAFT_561933 [Nemania sp. FL0031]|nr:hypothetical protein GGR51DRAFT_561933 [Nemania sp. FL0031]
MAQTQSETVLVDPGKATNVDIMLILGPGQKRLDPWISRPSAGDGITWLGEKLKIDIPNARISVCRYAEHEAWNYRVHAGCVRRHLERVRSGDTQPYPIVLVAYGLAGIVSAQVLQEESSLSRYVQGLVFFGTPFRGSGRRQLSDILRLLALPGTASDARLISAADVLQGLLTRLSNKPSIKYQTFYESSSMQYVDQHAAKILSQEAMYISTDCEEAWYNTVKKLFQELAQVEATLTDANRATSITVAGDFHGGSHRNNSGNVSYVYNGSR